MKIATVAAASAIMLATYHPPAVAAVPTTTLCQLSAQPGKWRGRVVRFTAIYITDRLEYSLLKDDRCPRIWFGLFNSQKRDRASIEAFDRAVVGDGRTIPSSRFKVEIVGRVSYRRDEGAAGRKSNGRIYVLKILTFQEIRRPLEGL